MAANCNRSRGVRTCVLLLSCCLAIALTTGAEGADAPSQVSSQQAALSLGKDVLRDSLTVSAGQFGGGVGLSFKLDLPGGRHLTPDLTLAYLSGGGNGASGLGWNLSVGAIERATRFGVNYGDDKYVLGIAGSNSELVQQDEVEYRTQVEGAFFRIRKLAQLPSNDTYWEVTATSGTVYRFGSNDAARQFDSADRTRVFAWRLDRIEDADGNFIAFDYIRDQGELYLKQVSYTGHLKSSPEKLIAFGYDARPDLTISYATNFRVVSSLRLATVDVSVFGEPVSQYRLNYERSQSTGRSLLTSLDRHGSDYKAAGSMPLRQATFTYQAVPIHSSRVLTGTVGELPNLPGAAFADVNGDGRTDFCWVGGGKEGGEYVKCILSTGDAFGPIISSGYIDWGVEDYRWWVDVNGDGKADFCRMVGAKMRCLLSTGDGFGREIESDSINAGYPEGRAWVDFNGDGKPDYCRVMGDAPNLFVKCLLSTGEGFGPDVVSGVVGPDAKDYRFWVDVNGDGKAAFCRMVGARMRCLLSTGSGFGNEIESQPINAGYPEGRAWVDINGDGKPDYCRVMGDEPNQIVKCLLSTGDGFGEDISSGLIDAGIGSFRFWIDVNGDGKADFCRLVGSESVGERWKCLLSNGAGFGDDVIVSEVNTYNPGWPQTRLFADAAGTGRPAYCRLFQDYSAQDIPIIVACDAAISDFPDLLSSATNSLGGAQEFKYSSTSTFPNQLLPSPLQVVNSVTLTDGRGNKTVADYTYAGGYYSLSQREFRGFSYVKQRQSTESSKDQQLVQETWFHQGAGTSPAADDPSVDVAYMRGKVYQMHTGDGLGKPIGRVTIEYKDSGQTGPWYNPPVVTTTMECENGSCDHGTRVNAQYDSFGNMVWRKRSPNVDSSLGSVVETWDYAPNIAKWIVAAPYRHSMFSEDGLTTRTDYYFDDVDDCNSSSTKNLPVRGHVTCAVERNPDGMEQVQRTAFDEYGNAKWRITSHGERINYVYDSSEHTYLTHIQNSLDHKASYRYYGVDDDIHSGSNYGQLRESVDISGGKTHKTYDIFGRDSRTTFPDHSWSEFVYRDVGSPQMQSIATHYSAGGSSLTFLDGQGRVYRTETSGPENKRIVNEVGFDSNGNLYRRAATRFVGDVPVWIGYSYDASRRLTQINRPDGTVVMSCYGPRIAVDIDSNGHSTRRTVDGWGRIVSAETFAGKHTCGELIDPRIANESYSTSTYAYDGLARLRSVTDSHGNITTMKFDSLGQKTEMIDPDMGKWTYKYDGGGSIVHQVDANGTVIRFAYDELGRVTRKSSEMKQRQPVLTDFVYDDASQGAIGRLARVIEDGITTSFLYDDLGRITDTKKTVGGIQYDTEFSYDGLGRVYRVKAKHARTEAIYRYDGPFIASASVNGREYVSLADHTPTGHPRRLAYGNGLRTRMLYGIYDASCPTNDGLLCFMETRLKDGSVLRRSEYKFDGEGNVQSISRNGHTERLAYDEFNRLVERRYEINAIDEQAQNIKPVAERFKYDSIGNILSSNAGDYLYGSAKPHAVTQVRAGEWFRPPIDVEYDMNGNAILRNGMYFEYDADNRPTSSKGGIFVWNYFDRDYTGRLVQSGNAFFRHTFPDDSSDCRTFLSIFSVCYWTLTVNGRPIAEIREDGQATYFVQDQLGSTDALVDAEGTDITDLRYSAYGTVENSGVYGPDRFPRTSIWQLFTSSRFDSETGLYWMGGRLYDPKLGRFLSPDTIVPDSGISEDLNRYSYARNNPLRYVDPSGHNPIVVGIIVGALIGGTTAAVRHENILRGIAIGAIFGAFTGGAASLAQGATELGKVGIYALAGSASGATTTAIFGGNVGAAALYGALFGAAGGGLASLGDITPFSGETPLGGTANFAVTSAFRNAVTSGSYAAVTHQDVLAALGEGAASGAAFAVANASLGHFLGNALGGEGMWDKADQVYIYEHGTKLPAWLQGAVTFGNVVVNQGTIDAATLMHELGHYEQGKTLSVGYAGAHALTAGISAGITALVNQFSENPNWSSPTHRFNPLECTWTDVPESHCEGH